MQRIAALFIFSALLFSCTSSTTSEADFEGDPTDGGEYVEYNNPPAEGFNLEGSDMLAMLLADKCMLAMGGREAWDNTKFISWNFLGRRDHLWNKASGDVRIEDVANEITILMNIKDMSGKVFKSGQPVSDSLDYFLQKGYEWWINDSYWLVMPYKLKDSGVTLKYLGEDTTQAGTPADYLEMTFDAVGVTPENMYKIWIDTDTKLVTQWAYYPDTTSVEPRFTTLWEDYKKYGDILLSGKRGDLYLDHIAIPDSVPSGIFEKHEIGIASLR